LNGLSVAIPLKRQTDIGQILLFFDMATGGILLSAAKGERIFLPFLWCFNRFADHRYERHISSLASTQTRLISVPQREKTRNPFKEHKSRLNPTGPCPFLARRSHSL
jgi:hypothetical protein